MANIRIIEPEEAVGRLKEIYDDLLKKRGKIAEVHKIQSLRPKTIMRHMDLYMEIMYKKSALSRAEREMIAVVVSAANHCEYCQVHHKEALKAFWKNGEKVDQLAENYLELDLSNREVALCDYAQIITLEPHSQSAKDALQALKDLSIEDDAILDVTLVTSYFNFVNRIVLSLGVNIEKDEGGGYNYEAIPTDE